MLLKRTMQVLGSIAIVFLVLMMISTVVNVSGRYLAKSPLIGTIELNRTLLVYVALFSIGYAQLMKKHIKVDIVLERFSPRTRLIMEGLALLLALAVMGYITYGSSIVAYEETVRGEAERGIINFPMWPGRIAVALGFLVLCIQYVVDILETRRSLLRERSPTE